MRFENEGSLEGYNKTNLELDKSPRTLAQRCDRGPSTICLITASPKFHHSSPLQPDLR